MARRGGVPRSNSYPVRLVHPNAYQEAEESTLLRGHTNALKRNNPSGGQKNFLSLAIVEFAAQSALVAVLFFDRGEGLASREFS